MTAATLTLILVNGHKTLEAYKQIRYPKAPFLTKKVSACSRSHRFSSIQSSRILSDTIPIFRAWPFIDTLPGEKGAGFYSFSRRRLLRNQSQCVTLADFERKTRSIGCQLQNENQRPKNQPLPRRRRRRKQRLRKQRPRKRQRRKLQRRRKRHRRKRLRLPGRLQRKRKHRRGRAGPPGSPAVRLKRRAGRLNDHPRPESRLRAASQPQKGF